MAFLQALLAATSANVTISDEIYLIVLCMPSIAACTLAHDAYHRNRPPALLDTYLFLVLIANTARTWDHWEIKDDPLVSVWSGLAAVAGAACAVWNWVERAAQSLPGLTANVTARLQKNRHFERSPLDKLSMFLFFGFLELRDKSDLPDFGPAVSSQKLADRFYALWATGMIDRAELELSSNFWFGHSNKYKSKQNLAKRTATDNSEDSNMATSWNNTSPAILRGVSAIQHLIDEARNCLCCSEGSCSR